MRVRGAFVAVGLLSVLLASSAYAGGFKHKKALSESSKHSPKIAKGALERQSAKRVTLTFNARLPDLKLAHEKAKVEVSVHKRRGGILSKPIRRKLKIPRDRRARVRVQIRGKAGKTLARTLAHGGKRKALERVSVTLENARDVVAGKRLDHVWVLSESGRELIGHRKDRRPPGAGRERAVGGIQGSEFTLNVHNGGGEPIHISSGSLTCSSGAGALDRYIVGGGGGNPLMVSTKVSEVTTGLVGTDSNEGFATSLNAANNMVSPELRNFGYEAALQYSRWGLIPPLFHDFRYEDTIEQLPDRVRPCSSGVHTFAVAADGAKSGNHFAKLYQFKRHSLTNSASDVFAFPHGTISATGFGDSLVNTSGDTWTVSWQPTGNAGYPTLSSTCSDADHWMQCKFPKGDPREQTQWVDVTVPGSHDSSTASLGLDVEPSTKGGCSGGTGPVDVLKNLPNVTRNWAVTQRTSLREQLEMGIRYLDMRIAYDGSQWRPIHTIYSADSLIQAEQMIASWAKQHPQEIVVVDFDSICLLNGGTASSFLEKLTEEDPATKASLCNQAYDIISPSQPVASNLATRTVADIRAGKGNVIVLLQDQGFDPDLMEKCGFAPEGKPNYTQNPPIATGVVPTYDAWPNQEGPPGSQTPVPVAYGSCALPDFSAGLNAKIAAYGYRTDLIGGLSGPLMLSYKKVSPITLLQSQMIYTLRFDGADAVISGDLVSDFKNCPRSLLQWDHALVEGGAPYTRADILASWGTNTHMVIADDVTRAYISQAVDLNP